MSWDQLTSISEEARETRQRELAEPPVACPFDGEPLDIKDGIRHCPLGNYEWPRDGKL